jgi:hypothetical protein
MYAKVVTGTFCALLREKAENMVHDLGLPLTEIVNEEQV